MRTYYNPNLHISSEISNIHKGIFRTIHPLCIPPWPETLHSLCGSYILINQRVRFWYQKNKIIIQTYKTLKYMDQHEYESSHILLLWDYSITFSFLFFPMWIRIQISGDI